MTKYTFNINNPTEQYIQISVEMPVHNDETQVFLPSWRPGRYELGNFAKNVRGFKVYDENGNNLIFEKESKDVWNVNTTGVKSIKVQYQFYANIINAGSSFLDASQLYVNPVNCCMYSRENYNAPVEIELNISESWEVASSMDFDGKVYRVENIDELMDTPFVASANLQKASYESHGVMFHVWFNGEIKPDWDRLIKDFQMFTDKQIEKFTEFPVKEYHFINQILPYKAYHGVEHQKSTMISLGPSYEVFNALYKELLGVSSHELYHTWNVKAIRPAEMYPYDFQKENYSKLGFICEGVTTYQGDLFLLKSGVFNDQQYFNELNAQLQRHFDNTGRFNYSVAESSFDTWLDGYVPGAPGRKVSIYTEGCLLAFVTDVRIRRATNNKYGIDEVMKRLYFNYALKNQGVSEEDYKSVVEQVSGENFDDFFKEHINGNKPYESILVDSLEYLGLELDHNPSPSFSESKLGFKSVKSGKNFKVTSMYPGGPAEIGGLMLSDEIIAVNGYATDGELDKWLNYFANDAKKLMVNRGGVISEFRLPEVNRHFYMKYAVKEMADVNSLQKRAFEHWKK